MEEASDVFAGLVAFFILASIYLIPTIVAICRKAYYSASAIIINVFFGWTFIGWVLALLLACLNSPRSNPQQIVVTQVVGNKNSARKTNNTKRRI